MTDLQHNPLLNFSGLPKFDQIRAEHVEPAIDHLIVSSRNCIDELAISNDVPTWANFAKPLEDIEEMLSRAWSQVGHMNSVVNSPELREAYNASLPKLTDFYSDLGQDERLYAKFRTLRNSEEFNTLNDAQQKIIENELRDFRLGGAELPEEEKIRFKAIQESLSKITTKFEENGLSHKREKVLRVEKADFVHVQ